MFTFLYTYFIKSMKSDVSSGNILMWFSKDIFCGRFVATYKSPVCHSSLYLLVSPIISAYFCILPRDLQMFTSISANGLPLGIILVNNYSPFSGIMYRICAIKIAVAYIRFFYQSSLKIILITIISLSNGPSNVFFCICKLGLYLRCCLTFLKID